MRSCKLSVAGSFGAGMASTGGGGILCLLCWKAGSVGYADVLLVSGQKPLETVGDDEFGGKGPRGMRTSRRARAPQLILLANGLVGLPETGSESSMAFSSGPEAFDEIEDTEPRLKKLV